MSYQIRPVEPWQPLRPPGRPKGSRTDPKAKRKRLDRWAAQMRKRNATTFRLREAAMRRWRKVNG